MEKNRGPGAREAQEQEKTQEVGLVRKVPTVKVTLRTQDLTHSSRDGIGVSVALFRSRKGSVQVYIFVCYLDVEKCSVVDHLQLFYYIKYKLLIHTFLYSVYFTSFTR